MRCERCAELGYTCPRCLGVPAPDRPAPPEAGRSCCGTVQGTAHASGCAVGKVTYATPKGDLFDLWDAVHRLYYAAVWYADRPVDEAKLWADVRDAAGFRNGESPRLTPPAPDQIGELVNDVARLESRSFRANERLNTLERRVVELQDTKSNANPEYVDMTEKRLFALEHPAPSAAEASDGGACVCGAMPGVMPDGTPICRNPNHPNPPAPSESGEHCHCPAFFQGHVHHSKTHQTSDALHCGPQCPDAPTPSASLREDPRLVPDHVVGVDEARESLSRFVASHFDKSDKQHARFSIPVNPNRDDDMILSAFIAQAALDRAKVERVEAEACALESSLDADRRAVGRKIKRALAGEGKP